MFAAGPPSAQPATTWTWRGLWGWSLLRYTQRTDRTSASPRTRPQKYASPVQFVQSARRNRASPAHSCSSGILATSSRILARAILPVTRNRGPLPRGAVRSGPRACAPGWAPLRVASTRRKSPPRSTHARRRHGRRRPGHVRVLRPPRRAGVAENMPSSALTSAPNLSRTRTASGWPAMAARCSAVTLSLSLACGSNPHESIVSSTTA